MRRARHLATDEPISEEMLRSVHNLALPLDQAADLDPLIDRIGHARFVLLGEASHGTADYYNWRIEISRRLITEKGFTFIAVEGDWPDCYRVNRFIKGLSGDGESAHSVLHAFDRWPTWMWANEEVVALAKWLHTANVRRPRERQIGFYGLDVYSLWDSLYAVLSYLHKDRSAALTAAQHAMHCFEPYGEEAQDYARATQWVDASCENEVVDLLAALRRDRQFASANHDEAHFNAEQNALIVKNAEHYYRTMVRGGPDSWNIRDEHMYETLDRLMMHHGPQSKAIVWAHNTHVGDARFTDMADDGMSNLGQMTRERRGDDGVVLVGFGSYRGAVIAGHGWDAPMKKLQVPPARENSWEDLLHRAGSSNKLLLTNAPGWDASLAAPRGHRAIGVVYHPERERYGNYVPTVLPRRYDAFLYIDRTAALHPLHLHTIHEELPETYPTGM